MVAFITWFLFQHREFEPATLKNSKYVLAKVTNIEKNGEYSRVVCEFDYDGVKKEADFINDDEHEIDLKAGVTFECAYDANLNVLMLRKYYDYNKKRKIITAVVLLIILALTICFIASLGSRFN